MELRIEGLTVEYGRHAVVRDLDLTVGDGGFVALVGPSGCGKTTTLGFIAGFVRAKAGRLVFDGADVTAVQPRKRGIGYVFQDYAIYPHMTVRENIRFPLDAARMPRQQAEADVSEVAALVGVGELLGRLPHQLSGGQRQRVALARALVKKPVVLLLDEPLSNLDAHLRVEVRAEIRRLQLSLGMTTVFVTHDQAEAMAISDRVAVMSEGRIDALTEPAVLYAQPPSLFAARFIGSPRINIWEVDGPDGGLARELAPGVRTGLVVGVRPEHVVVGDGGIPATVRLSEQLGRDVLLHLSVGESSLQALVPAGQAGSVEPGSEVRVRVAPQDLHVFEAASGRRVELAEGGGPPMGAQAAVGSDPGRPAEGGTGGQA